jgi:decaprenylphospho-beta-D-ribofuranose 2-oxidase
MMGNGPKYRTWALLHQKSIDYIKLQKELVMKRKWFFLICIIVYISLFTISIGEKKESENDIIMTDVSRLMPIKVKKVIKGKEEEMLYETLKEANEKNLKVSIAGKRHSMGGHTYYKDAVVLDMTEYNKILDFDLQNKSITVQSGATWDDIQKYVNPHGLAVKVMQSQNIFTIGGSLSVNAHGRDIRYGSLIDTIKSFRLMNADGEIINVSREENNELFSLVIGGYGLFGVILDVELELTDDELYEMKMKSMDYNEYADYFIKEVENNPNVRMHLSRISTAPDSFLKEMYVTDYVIPSGESQQTIEDYNTLKEDRYTWLTKFSLGISRKYDWGKNVFWGLQEKYFEREDGTFISRNNVMRSESEFLLYENTKNTDVLQEYFVPIEEFPVYIDDLRDVLSQEELNLINITIRYVQQNEDAVLSYAKDDMFALVLLINQGLSKDEQKETEKVIRKMIDVTLEHNGSYYLPYMLYPTKEQFHKAYPRASEFFQKKFEYDPNERYINLFYERYK